MHTLVRLMDDAIPIPGTRYRIGWDAIVGLVVPGAGDAAAALSQVALLFAAVRMAAPRSVIARMLLNVAIDALLGSVPVLGDLFDVGFKANRRNLELLQSLQTTPDAEPRSRIGDYTVLVLASTLVLVLMSLPIGLAIWLISLL